MATHAHTTPERRPEDAPGASGRRTLFGAITALACASGPVVSAAPSLDAGLIRLCNAFHAAHTASHAADDASWEAHLDRRNTYVDAIEGMAATTDAGRLAKARVALVLLEEEANTNNQFERFTLGILRDLVGSAVA